MIARKEEDKYIYIKNLKKIKNFFFFILNVHIQSRVIQFNKMIIII